MKSLLAVDQSLNHSGFCIWDGSNYYYDVLKYTKKELEELDTLDKIINLREKIKELVRKFNPDVIIREGFAFGVESGKTFDLGGLGFTIDILCRDLDIEEKIINITIHKKFTAGKGNAPKSIMLLKIYKHWDIELDDDNIADALSMVKTYQSYQRYLQGDHTDLTKAQKEVMTKLCKEIS